MRLNRAFFALLLAAGAVTGCTADRSEPVGPAVGGGPDFKRMTVPPALTGGAADTVTVVRRAAPLAADVVRSAVIGAAGGTIEIAEAGLRLVVPANAVSAPTTFTATALAGGQVAYEFGPHGLVFGVPLRLEQSADGIVLPRSEYLAAGYFRNRADLDNEGAVGAFDEARPGKRDAASGHLIFDIGHFSGYAVAVGKAVQ